MLTWQKKSLIHRGLFGKSYMAKVFLAFAYGCDITTLSKHFHDELFCGILRQTPNKHSLTTWRAVSGGWRRKIWNKKEKRDEYILNPVLLANGERNTSKTNQKQESSIMRKSRSYKQEGGKSM